MSNGNPESPQNKILWWVIGSIAAPLMLALTGTVLNLGITSAQRIASLEAQFIEIHRQLEGVGTKLDRLLEKRP